MDIQIVLVFLILGASIALFVSELLQIDKIAFLIIVALVLFGLVTPEEAISGFSNPATITVLMLMILSIGMEENGVIKLLSDSLKKLSFLPLLLMIPVFMIISASISAFISTTAVVLIMLKLIAQLAKKYNFSSSKLLMPISFAGILGGSCTLMGTSTNILVNAIAGDMGVEKFSFFEFSIYGLIFLAIGVVVVTIASRFLPQSDQDNLRNVNDFSHYLFKIKVKPDSKLIGKAFSDIPFFNNPNISTLKLIRDNQVNNKPGKYTTLRENDELILRSDLQDFSSISTADFELSLNQEEIELEDGPDQQKYKNTYIELLILPGSDFIGKKLHEISIHLPGTTKPIGIQKKKGLQIEERLKFSTALKSMRISPGDRILVKAHKTDIQLLNEYDNLVVLRKQEESFHFHPFKRAWSILTLIAVIVLAASGLLSILASSIIGVGSLLISNCINLGKVYKRVNWQIIFLLAGMIPLGVALSNTGTDMWISDHLRTLLHNQSNLLSIGIIFGATMLLSGFISNNATAIIFTPIAISLAIGLNLPPKPFILAVLFGANFSFFTPMGYQTNTIVYGTGIYRFRHFAIVGGILSFVLFIVGTVLFSRML